jgi:hypothetical protein
MEMQGWKRLKKEHEIRRFPDQDKRSRTLGMELDFMELFYRGDLHKNNSLV